MVAANGSPKSPRTRRLNVLWISLFSLILLAVVRSPPDLGFADESDDSFDKRKQRKSVRAVVVDEDDDMIADEKPRPDLKSIAASPSKRKMTATVPTSKEPGKFVITFLGDTMVANNAYNWEHAEWGNRRPIDEGFHGVKHLLEKSDFIIMNLEGAVTLNPITTDPQRRKGFNYSFGMDPRVVKVLKELGVGACNRANNHVSDRNTEGWKETGRHLEEAGIAWFGTGFTMQEQVAPIIIDTPQGRVGITGFMDDYCCDSLPIGKNGDREHVTARPRDKAVPLAMELLDKANVQLKIAFPHWIKNYKSYVSEKVIVEANDLVDAGYDVIIGSAGSHTVQPFDWVKEAPTMYDIGNFVFMKPGYWYRIDELGNKPLTYGTVTHLILEGLKPTMLEIHCTQNDQDKVHYKPRVCTAKEAEDLFSHLGPYLEWKKGEIVARVDLTKPLESKIAPPEFGKKDSSKSSKKETPESDKKDKSKSAKKETSESDKKDKSKSAKKEAKKSKSVKKETNKSRTKAKNSKKKETTKTA